MITALEVVVYPWNLKLLKLDDGGVEGEPPREREFDMHQGLGDVREGLHEVYMLRVDLVRVGATHAGFFSPKWCDSKRNFQIGLYRVR